MQLYNMALRRANELIPYLFRGRMEGEGFEDRTRATLAEIGHSLGACTPEQE